MTDYDSLNGRIENLNKKYSPTGDSRFRGVTGNLFMVARLSGKLHGDIREEAEKSTRRLEAYLALLESANKNIVEAEMWTRGGYLPLHIPETSGHPHDSYVIDLIEKVTGNPLIL